MLRIWKDEKLCTREIRYEISWSIFRTIYSHILYCACKKGARGRKRKGHLDLDDFYFRVDLKWDHFNYTFYFIGLYVFITQKLSKRTVNRRRCRINFRMLLLLLFDIWLAVLLFCCYYSLFRNLWKSL